jgi:hypothetical protein
MQKARPPSQPGLFVVKRRGPEILRKLFEINEGGISLCR